MLRSSFVFGYILLAVNRHSERSCVSPGSPINCSKLPHAAKKGLGNLDALFHESDSYGAFWRLAACAAGALSRVSELTGPTGKSRGGLTLADPRRVATLDIEAERAAMWVREWTKIFVP